MRTVRGGSCGSGWWLSGAIFCDKGWYAVGIRGGGGIGEILKFRSHIKD